VLLVAAEGAGLHFWDLGVKPQREMRPFNFAAYQWPGGEEAASLADSKGPRLMAGTADGAARLWGFTDNGPRATAYGTVGVLRLPPALPPLDPNWLEATAKLDPDKHLEAVAAELRKRNPGFDGKLEHVIDLGQVIELRLRTEAVSDLSPLRVLKGLKVLRCRAAEGKGKLVELSPLYKLPLQTLDVSGNPVTNLAALDGTPLTELNCSHTRVIELALVPRGSLAVLSCDADAVRDLEVLKAVPSLREINGKRAEDFWKEQEGKKPAGQP
jgi:hypothetical protein